MWKIRLLNYASKQWSRLGLVLTRHQLTHFEKGGLLETRYWVDRIRPEWFRIVDSKDYLRYSEAESVDSHWRDLLSLTQDVRAALAALDNADLYQSQERMEDVETTDWKTYLTTNQGKYIDPVGVVASFCNATLLLIEALLTTEHDSLKESNLLRMRTLLLEVYDMSKRLTHFQLK